MPYTLLSREEWSRHPAPECLPVGRLKTPVEAVYFGYTRKPYRGAKESPGHNPNREQTLKEVHYIVKGDMNKHLDTRYNFLLGNDGCVYEGRGWRYDPFLPSNYKTPFRFKGIFIVFIGDFSERPPPEGMFRLREEFLKDAVRTKKLRKKFVLISMEAPWHPNHQEYTYRF